MLFKKHNNTHTTNHQPPKLIKWKTTNSSVYCITMNLTWNLFAIPLVDVIHIRLFGNQFQELYIMFATKKLFINVPSTRNMRQMLFRFSVSVRAVRGIKLTDPSSIFREHQAIQFLRAVNQTVAIANAGVFQG